MTNSFRPSPRLTIGLPVYNGEEYLAQSIESMLSQTYQDWQLLISDNASTDGTRSICEAYVARDPRIRYVRNQENIGLARNFNRTFRLSKTELFKWQAHDDICLPTFLESCVAALDANPIAAVAYTQARAIDGNNRVVTEFQWDTPTRYDQSDPESRFRLLAGGFDDANRAGRQHPGVYFFGVMRSETLRRTRLQLSHMWADITMLSELTLEAPFIEVPEVLFLARVDISNASALMKQGDLQAWAGVLDPRYGGRVGSRVSHYRRYWENYVSVTRSNLPIGAKVRLAGFCSGILLRRVQELARGS